MLSALEGREQFFLISGPCVVENQETCAEIAAHVKRLTDRLEIPYIFKASYKKANRSRLDSFTGIGDKTALAIIRDIGREHQVWTLTDVHTEEVISHC